MEASVKLETPASPALEWSAAVEALIKGARDSASLLGVLLKDHAPGSPTRLLAEEIVGSISRALFAFDSGKPEVFQHIKTSSPCSEDRRTEVIGGKRKITPEGRVYRRRSQPYSCTRITKSTIDDAYTWRKYGQKPIYNSPFPRSYYRCTHKHDLGCQATRQVQQSEEDPKMFVIAYMGEHTCRSNQTKPSSSGSYIISFGSGIQDPIRSPSLPLPKLDPDEEVVTSASPPESSSEEEVVLPDIWGTEVATPTMSLSALSDLEFSSECLDLDFDFMRDNESVNLDDLLKEF